MAEETDLTILILREIQATQSEMKSDIGHIKDDIVLIKDKLVQHSLQLSSQGGSLGEIAHILRYLLEWARPDISRELLALKQRVEALEAQRQ